MTDRTSVLTVMLEKPIRVDDVEHITRAIQQMRGVAGVQVELDPDSFAIETAKAQLRLELWQTIRDMLLR